MQQVDIRTIIKNSDTLAKLLFFEMYLNSKKKMLNNKGKKKGISLIRIKTLILKN